MTPAAIVAAIAEYGRSDQPVTDRDAVRELARHAAAVDPLDPEIAALRADLREVGFGDFMTAALWLDGEADALPARLVYAMLAQCAMNPSTTGVQP